ncbi:MAG TPA: OmpA family protein [Polyangia bacterium]|jgi:outer membrane protein OmpA-like peptidoglycan-associated protein|nr:OmpA family protein [Polyangia bacterium]
MRDARPAARLISLLACAGFACASGPRPKELLALEQLRTDPTLSDTDRQAFDLLAAADALLLRAEIDWDHHDRYATRRDALMGQIKMKTALALIERQRAADRTAQLGAEQALADDEYADLSDRLAVVHEQVALLERFQAATTTASRERQALSSQIAAERQRADALDGLRRAELALRAAETVDASTYAKAKDTAAAGMLQQAHKDFDAGHWDAVLTGTALATMEAEQAIAIARPSYEAASTALTIRARDRALEGDATAISTLRTRLERDGDLQRLVLVLDGLFTPKRSVLTPDEAKVLDPVKDLLAKYPTYPIQIAAFPEEQATSEAFAALALARANAVYWALVSRGIDPKRLSVDVKGAAAQTGRGKDARVELSILYHIAP